MKLWFLLKLYKLWLKVGSYLDWQEWTCPACGLMGTIPDIRSCHVCDATCCEECLTPGEDVDMCMACVAAMEKEMREHPEHFIERVDDEDEEVLP